MRQSSYYLATTLSCLVAATSIRSGNAFQSSGIIGGPRLLSSDQRTFDRHVVALHQAFRNDDILLRKQQHREPQSKLSAVSIADLDAQQLDDDSSFSIPDLGGVQQVLTTALMITANTVGASALVLPEVAAKPGFAITSGLFAAAYIVNLISGLVLAEVAIKQHESSGNGASSFKDLADQNLPSAGVMISCLSMFTNACILAFDFNRAGDLLSSGGLDHTLGMVGFGAAIAAMIATQSGERVSNIASMTVTMLFVSFFGLLAPNLANISDPIAQALAPGQMSNDMMSAISEAFPIIFMTTVYQNVVPTVTKIMDYDRTKSMATIALGSLLPICIYLAWCFVGTATTTGGSLMTVFSVAAIVGSSIGCTLSLSEEVGSFVGSSSSSDNDTTTTTTTTTEESTEIPNLLTVATSVGVPLAAAYMFASGEDFSSALKVVGSYASPVLYGVIPAAMAYSQREKLPQDVPNIVPGGAVGGLGVASACLVLNEVTSASLLF